MRAADADPSRQIRTIFQSNLDATQKRDLRKALATIHSKSPVFAPSAQILEKLFETFELKFDLMAFKYIATDEGYAIARVKYKAVKVKGPEFHDYVVTALAVFKQEAGEWKLWQQANLELENLEPPAPAKEAPPKEPPAKVPAKDATKK